MSTITNELADALAIKVIDAADRLDDDRLAEEIATAIGASSPTTEEAFRTAVRVRLAIRRAEGLLEKKLSRLEDPK